MLGIVGVSAFLFVLGLSLVITKMAATALRLTGLSEEAAKFQARSAFTGTGFTTSEARKVVDHPVRRRIIMWLMTLRSAGLMTIIISLILTLGVSGDEEARVDRLIWIVGGVVVLGLLSKSKSIDKWISYLMEKLLKKWTDLDTRDYFSLLKLSGVYAVMEIKVKEGDWLACKNLSACRLPEEGVTVLGIYRDDGGYVGVPSKETEIFPGDTVILYGRSKTLKELDKRRADARGEAAHQEAKSQQKKHKERQDKREQAHKEERKQKLNKNK